MPKLRLPAPDILLILICVVGLFSYYFHIVPTDQAQFVLAVVGIAGLVPVAISAARSMTRFEVTIDLLASVALVFSLLDGEWASAVFINLMLASARLFSSYTHDSIHQALKFLLKLRPEVARVSRSGKLYTIKVDDVKVKDTLIVRVGEQIPVDGVITQGEATVDQSSFTGESIPVNRGVGEHVFGSTVVVDGSIHIRAEKVGVDTAFEHIVKLVDSAQNNKARITGIADKFATIYIVVVLIAAVVIYATTGRLDLILSVLLVVCADDIAVAIPLSMTAAISYAARHGVIIKGSNYLEALGNVKTIVMDKTGTLTQGRLRVSGFHMLTHGFDHEEMLSVAAGLSSQSEHPVSKAIVDYAKAVKVPVFELDKFAELNGQGLHASFKRKNAFLGRLSYLHNLQIEPTEHQLKEIKRFTEMGYNVTVLAYAKHLIGIFTLRDEIKPEAAEAITALRKLHVREIIMLTGDNETVAMHIAQRAGLTGFKANMLPEDKLAYLKTKVRKQGLVAMIGDGVNDAPALAMAPIGIAMGAIGSDVAIESADIVLMRDNLLQIAQTKKLANEVMKIAKQNFAYWGLSNVIGLILVFGGVLNPAGAALFNFLTDFGPILNALRVLKFEVYDSESLPLKK